MNKEMLQYSFFLLATFLIGTYFGILANEINTVYQCQLRQAITIDGVFWKDRITFKCEKPL